MQDFDSKNILWIVGDAGVGKSTIATTIAREFTTSCARFFCDRDKSELRDPRLIWRTIAYNLAANHDDMKAELRQTLETSKPKDYSVIDQFENLIKTPLMSIRKETAYVVVIIDALDECDLTEDDGEDSWDSLRNSFVSWSTLPGVFKLIVTSRHRPDIHEKLGRGELSHRPDRRRLRLRK